MLVKTIIKKLQSGEIMRFLSKIRNCFIPMEGIFKGKGIEESSFSLYTTGCFCLKWIIRPIVFRISSA